MKFFPLFFLPSLAMAAGDTPYILNTLLLLICGVLVMFMAAGFAMLEAGMVRSKSVAVILTKNITLYAIAGIMFFLTGYGLMYVDVGQYIGTLTPWSASEHTHENYSAASFWFFQMVFVATTASIVSGTLAERIKIWPFFIFTALLTGVLYPIVGSWKWGEGWLHQIGFLDFAGSTIVHSVGGWAALIGAILLGSRRGRFDGKAKSIPGTSLPQVTLGTFILWLGWFGFNGGSQLAFGTVADADAVSNIFVNTNTAAAAGVLSVVAVSQLVYKRIDLPTVLNGALAGLVSITAEPLTPNVAEAALIGSVGGLLMMSATVILERLKIDDVVGAIPVHLVGGIWGTFAVIFTNDAATFYGQALGIVSIGAFMVVTSLIIWTVLKKTMGIRLHWSKEDEGPDMHEIGLRAYNI